MDSSGSSSPLSTFFTAQHAVSAHPLLHVAATFVTSTQDSIAPTAWTSVEWLQLVGILIALVLSACSSAAETALTSVSRIKIKNLVEEGDATARQIEHLLTEPNKFLTTILVINNVAVIVASTLATVLALKMTQSWGELISTLLIALVVLIFCEITPKTAAVQNPERWARVLVHPVQGAAWLLTPVIWFLGVITASLVRLLGGRVRRRGPFVTEEELRMLVTVGEEEGIIEEEEREMIHSIFELGDRPVREIMVPRIDMVTLEGEDTLDEASTLIMQGGQSRIPVYEDTIDNIIGVLYAKDLLRHLRLGNMQARVRDFVRPAYFVPESKKLDDLLHELQHQRIHMAIVVDEYGAVAGLVTIEDLVEEIIGDIQDEYDKEEVLYERLGDDEYEMDAKISIDDFNELLDTKLTDEDYDTLGGFVYTQLDKVPSVGDEVKYQNLTLTVLSTKGRRITKVRVIRHAEDHHAPDEDEDAHQQHAQNGAQSNHRSHSERSSASNLHAE
ncbi:MAG TPA: hemolysin family protein [Ktedonobacterales bacterium]|nr:hemolysin family protein [Ktedonobacterales bacterium]